MSNESKLFTAILSGFVVTAAGFAAGSLLTKKLFEKKIEEEAHSAFRKVIDDEAYREEVRTASAEVASRIKDSDVTDKVTEVIKSKAEDAMRKAISTEVDAIAKDEMKKKVQNAVDDYDIRHSMRNVLEDVAERYVRNEGDGIIRKQVTKEVAERTKSLETIARVATYCKNI